MAQMKVSELPKDEQDKLIAEANELEIRGILTSWGVETLKKKIAEAKAGKAGEDEQENEPQGEETQEQNDGEQQENAGEDEQNGENDEQTEGEDEQNSPEDEQNAENMNNDENADVEPIPDNGGEKEDKDELYPQKDDVKICHICRSKVIDGKCTGCGFSV